MDDIALVKERLKNHANLPITNEATHRDESLLYQLYLADRQRTPPNLDLFRDVVPQLAALNTHFNGPDPDTRLPGPRAQAISDDVAYSVACILEGCLGYYRKWLDAQLFSSDALRELLTGIHMIAFCWAQILAGDVTDLLEGFEVSAE